MREKFYISEGISDAFDYFKKGFGRLMLNWFINILVMLVPILLVTKSIIGTVASTFNGGIPGMSGGSNIGLILLVTIPLGLLSLVFAAVYIKITDDLAEKRELTYGEQLSYCFKRLGRIIGSNIVAGLPMILIGGIMLVQLTRSFMSPYGSPFGMFAWAILVIIYSIFVSMVTQSIIIEDTGVIESIKRSFSVMSKNFFKFLGLMILVGIVSGIFGLIVSKGGILLAIIRLIINIFFGIYSSVFMATLFKQVSNNNNPPSEGLTYETESPYFED